MKDSYQSRSNRESGFGRYDVLMIPNDKSKKDVIIEFKKKRDDETIDKALENALNQIVEKKYEQELLSIGIEDILRMGIVFDGKIVKVGTI